MSYLLPCTAPPAYCLDAYHALLATCGLSDEGDADYTALLFDDNDELCACGSLRGNVLKQIAVLPRSEQQGYCAEIVTELVRAAFKQGETHLFLYTKPMHRGLFSSFGFFPIVETSQMLMMENRRHGLDDFLAALPHPDGTVGAIVCNCNPFTLGHRALIEHAAARCDALLVFVLSEDCALFPARDRYALVRAGTAEFANVSVVQSSDYLISRATFPAYFLKDSADPEQARCDLDLYLFAKRIAPALNIRSRFVGEEPFDAVTRHSNERMKQLLPLLGIQVEEIPRWKNISASQVRRLLQEGRVQETQPLLPATTYEYCEHHFGGNADRA